MLRNPFDGLNDSTEKKLLKFRVLLAGVILGGVMLCSGVILTGLTVSNAAKAPARAAQEASWESLKPLKELCLGGAGNSSAANFTPGAGPHRLVVFRSNIAGATDLSTFYNRTEDYPAEWRAAELAQAQFVACIHTGSIVVEECAYTLPNDVRATLQRMQLTAQVSVYAAQTGELLGQAELPGALPRACQAQEQFAETLTTQSVAGDPVPPAQIEAWLRGLVES